MTTNLKCTVGALIQGFAESLQQECSKPAQNVMIELYFCGPDLLFMATTLPNKEGSWVLGLQGSVAKILQNPVQQIAEILQQKSLISKTTVDLTQSFVAVLKGNCVKFGFAVLDVCCKISAICCSHKIRKSFD